MPPSTTHLTAAEQALREFAYVSRGQARERAERSAAILAWMARASEGRPLSEGATARSELVDALLEGTDALRWKADQERQGIAAPGARQGCEREARAAEYEGHADAILELDREIGVGHPARWIWDDWGEPTTGSPE